MVVKRLQQAYRLVFTVHARLEASSAIGAWHDRFHELSETLIQAEMSPSNISSEKAKALAEIWVFMIEGLLAQPRTINPHAFVLSTWILSRYTNWRDSTFLRAVKIKLPGWR